VENGKVKPADNAHIDLKSNWASQKVSSILSESPTLLEYAYKARGGKEWDIKSDEFLTTPYFGSLLYGKYASARDAGNFAAGAVAEMSIFPNGLSDYGFGTYNLNNNSVWGSFKSIFKDVFELGTNSPMGMSNFIIKAKFGEHPLTRDGIEAGKYFVQSQKILGLIPAFQKIK
jgi:hypothetical protein